MEGKTRALLMLRYEDLSQDNVLKAIKYADGLHIPSLANDPQLTTERYLKIYEQTFLLEQARFIKHSPKGIQITNRGRIHLIQTSQYLNFWAIVIPLVVGTIGFYWQDICKIVNRLLHK